MLAHDAVPVATDTLVQLDAQTTRHLVFRAVEQVTLVDGLLNDPALRVSDLADQEDWPLVLRPGSALLRATRLVLHRDHLVLVHGVLCCAKEVCSCSSSAVTTKIRNEPLTHALFIKVKLFGAPFVDQSETTLLSLDEIVGGVIGAMCLIDFSRCCTCCYCC